MCAAVRVNGSDGCDSTGATTCSSTIIASAKPPLKHMPSAPTPGPPSSACRSAARARSQPMTGEVRPVRQVSNSRETHTLSTLPSSALPLGGSPGVPVSDGSTTVNPASTTSWANASTDGVMAGISWTTTTPGPVPCRSTSRVLPSAVKLLRSQPSRALTPRPP